jgi:hypothetical protein
MAVNYVTIRGYIKDGELQVELPENVTDGEVELRVAVEESLTQKLPSEFTDEVQSMTDEELEGLLKFEGRTLGEIIESEYIGSWADMGITDSAAWIEEQRRKMWAERGARWTDS